MKPHEFQDMGVDALFNYFYSKQGNPIVAMPTGSGKSVVIAFFLKRAFEFYPYQKVLVCTHVKELVEQNYNRLKKAWPQAPAGINSAGLNRRDYYHPIIFAGIGSIVNNIELLGKIDLLIVDECHLLGDSENSNYQKLIIALKRKNPYFKVIGLSATCWRTGMGALTNGSVFTDVCFDMTTPEAFRWLVAQGYLSPLIPKRTSKFLDVDGVKIQNGDFKQNDLQKAVDKLEITQFALEEAIRLGSERKRWLIFCAGVEHAIHTSEILNSLGVSCAAVHSKLTSKERDATLEDFRAGTFRAVTNNNVLTTGFDLAEIDLIIMLRPTTSALLWVQMLGRGTRCLYAPGFDLGTLEERFQAIQLGGKTDCLVLDFARNTERLGPINDPYIPEKKKMGGKGMAPVKDCPDCMTYNPASVRTCQYCGYEFPPPQTKIVSTASHYELISGDLPVIQEVEVHSIVYGRHKGKDGKIDTFKVTYYCNLQIYHEFICIEHPGGSLPKRKAYDWWKKHTHIPLPNDIASALYLSEKLAAPTHLRVWTNKKYPEIMAYCFDGSKFGREPPSDKKPFKKINPDNWSLNES